MENSDFIVKKERYLPFPLRELLEFYQWAKKGWLSLIDIILMIVVPIGCFLAFIGILVLMMMCFRPT